MKMHMQVDMMLGQSIDLTAA